MNGAWPSQKLRSGVDYMSLKALLESKIPCTFLPSYVYETKRSDDRVRNGPRVVTKTERNGLEILVFIYWQPLHRSAPPHPPVMKGCLKLACGTTRRCPHPRKCVAFCAEGSEEVHVADEWDRTPAPARKLSYQ